MSSGIAMRVDLGNLGRGAARLLMGDVISDLVVCSGRKNKPPTCLTRPPPSLEIIENEE